MGMLFLTLGLELLYTKTTMADSMSWISKSLEWSLTLKASLDPELQGHMVKS